MEINGIKSFDGNNINGNNTAAQYNKAVTGEQKESALISNPLKEILGRCQVNFRGKTAEKALTKEVIMKFDEVLADKVYKKIWSELAPKDKYFLSFIVKKDKMEASELLELTKQSHSSWSIPRARLKEKGIIDVETRGVVSIKLPRFKEFVDEQIALEGELQKA